MTTLSYYLKKRKNKNEHPLYLRVTHDRESRYIRLDIGLEKEHWNEEKEIVRKSHPHYEKINRYLKVKKLDSDTLVLELKQFKPEADIDLMQKVLETGSLDGVKKSSRVEFLSFAEELRAGFKAQGSLQRYKNYGTVLNKLKGFWPKNKLYFTDMDVQFLRRFETHLISKHGNAVNTVGNNMKKIKRVFNVAINEGKIPADLYPFRIYKIPSEPVTKSKLSQNEISAIECLDLKPGTRIFDSKNIFLFAYYCRGMRFGDAVTLKWSSIKEGYLDYEMRKTGKRMYLKLTGKALRIIKQYRGTTKPNPKHFVFPLLDNRKDYSDENFLSAQISSKTAIVNKYLKEIKGQTDINENITTHIARHSFAQLANKKKVRLLEIKEMLGHSSVETTTKYLESLGNDHLDKTVEGLFN
ncbi:MAG: site-specific integrase [Gracilimonas sp.]|uniref:site-specific integrase n=1 Tax=Gracilimonas sp. TaxID=1974203 RepID=UPI001B12B458|nr:site-specific integrase [Gracilimonas sp.]MBO6584758.1 site-specific integrase [Gracilimonas sp.]MBO6615971.1 site-specific integrase [Gracilimonas sp.]